MNPQSVLRSTYDRWVFVASGLSATAGIIHAYYMPEHFEMWVGYGVFFLAVTICQVLLALVLLAVRPVSPVVLWAGIIGNVAIIVMWIVARTSGLPYGPMIGEVEEIGVLDLSSKIAEFGVILCMVALLRMKSVSYENNNMAVI
ncbi:MAG: hypothetical protein HYX49_03755 [Chloroflexi bacterium]|nr:hypothetical protein [Chloroflexota bacterium]